MDLVAKRYSDPCFLLNGMIQSGRLPEFVDSLIDTSNKEKEEDANWQFFLHKVFEGTYGDFLEEQENIKKNQNLSDTAIEATLQHSMNILNRFNPEQGG